MLLMFIISVNCHKTYFLSQDCVPGFGSNTRHLYFDLTGAVIYSHPRYAQIFDNLSFSTLATDYTDSTVDAGALAFKLARTSSTGGSNPNPDLASESLESVVKSPFLYGDAYPVNFSCEVFIRSAPSSRIMLQVQSLYIPSKRPICDDNYLYVFDSNTPHFRAMTEAGGEKGLCQRQFPEEPIFTTKSYMTIVFRSTTSSAMETGKEPGFKLILTSTKAAQLRGVCESNYFYCGRQPPLKLAEDYLEQYQALFTSDQSIDHPHAITRINQTRDSREKLGVISKVRNLGRYVMRTKRLERENSISVGYCIPKSLQCDGILHCHNARDELPSLRIEPSQIPGHLLRDLVGAHLVPTDLKNVGCVTYQIGDHVAQMRRIASNFGRGRRLGNNLPGRSKNNSYESAWPQLNGPESTILIVGCVGVVIFVVLVLLCSYYQCVQPHRFRGQHFLLPKHTSRNTSLILHSAPSDYEIGKPVDTNRTLVQQKYPAACLHKNQSGLVTSRTIHSQRHPFIWAPVGHKVVRSVTRSTLNSTLESYQSSTTGKIIPLFTDPTQSIPPPQEHVHSSTRMGSGTTVHLNILPTEILRSKSTEFGQAQGVPSETNATEWIALTHHCVTEPVEFTDTRGPNPISLTRPNQKPNAGLVPFSSATVHVDAGNSAKSTRYTTARYVEDEKKPKKEAIITSTGTGWTQYTFPQNVWLAQVSDLTPHGRPSEKMGIADSAKPSPPPPPPPYPIKPRRYRCGEESKRATIDHLAVQYKWRNTSVPPRSRPPLPAQTASSRGRSNPNECAERKQSRDPSTWAEACQPDNDEGSRSKQNPTQFTHQLNDNKLRVKFATGSKGMEKQRDHRLRNETRNKPTKSKHRRQQLNCPKRDPSGWEKHLQADAACKGTAFRQQTQHVSTNRKRSSRTCSCRRQNNYIGEGIIAGARDEVDKLRNKEKQPYRGKLNSGYANQPVSENDKIYNLLNFKSKNAMAMN